ncbi:MAG: DNA repair protein RadA [Candidatus Zixiibacteriota bacterium]
MVIARKIKTAYFCSQCGAEHQRWQGQCRECASWNSLIEEKVPERKKGAAVSTAIQKQLIPDISLERMQGYVSGIGEFDRVLGGQLLPGMTVLLGGDPGIGKSTLMLQAADAYSKQGIPVLYVTGEESLSQLKLRADRLKVSGERVTVINATAIDDIAASISEGNFGVVLIDSVQTVSSPQFDSPPGTVAQIREAASALISKAKAEGFALFLVGHVTKEGIVAGPKVLEHMVDTVVYFEGDSTHLYRMLRAAKNRFGSVAEIGLFEMGPSGLQEVINPSSFFLSGDHSSSRTGAVVAAVVEGNRPLLVEVQALVSRASYGTPQRVAGGIDSKRLALLLAILEKRCDYPMSSHDVFVSVAGGLRVSEPALDLPVMAAITSSLLNRPIHQRSVVIGEVGLSGEVRAVTYADRRASESTKLGFTTVVLPDANQSQITTPGCDVTPVSNIQQALDVILE